MVADSSQMIALGQRESFKGTASAWNLLFDQYGQPMGQDTSGDVDVVGDNDGDADGQGLGGAPTLVIQGRR
jgi:hypothetical protein